MKNIFMFDVESTSLYGTGFAVGAVVYSREDKKIIDKFELKSRESEWTAGDWVKENVIPFLSDMESVETDLELRDKFYEFYMKHRNTSEIWSDVNFPVESNFLADVVSDDENNRMWNMPYPLKDVSAFVDVEIDRAEKSGIKDLRKHNPFDDTLASLYCLLQVIGE